MLIRILNNDDYDDDINNNVNVCKTNRALVSEQFQY